MTAGTITDIVIASVVAVSGLFALSRGFVKEVLSVASWLGAVVVALYGFSPARPHVRALLDFEIVRSTPLIADIVTAAVLFLGSLFLFSFVSHQFTKLVRGSAVGALDRTLGFLFGIARGLLIIVVLFLLVVAGMGSESQPRWFRDARLMPVVAVAAKAMKSVLPESLRRRLPEIKAPKPTPAPPPRGGPSEEKGGRTGYRPSERLGMERLIEGSQ